jgi:hypothetical protein
MVKYIALLRAVNVGGTGKLPMSNLKGSCRPIIDRSRESPPQSDGITVHRSSQ